MPQFMSYYFFQKIYFYSVETVLSLTDALIDLKGEIF